MNRGFTLIELLVSIAIFIFMTALVVAKFGNFNSSTLLTDEAYDIALVIRQAQTYGTSVKNADLTGGTDFGKAYGVDFDLFSINGVDFPDRFTLFSATVDASSYYITSTVPVATYFLKNGSRIQYVCIGKDQNACSKVFYNGGAVYGIPSYGHIRIFFVRPNPDAHIRSATDSLIYLSFYSSDGTLITNQTTGNVGGVNNYAQIIIKAPDGNTRSINVLGNGQIYVN